MESMAQSIHAILALTGFINLKALWTWVFMEVSVVGMIAWVIGHWWLNLVSIPSPLGTWRREVGSVWGEGTKIPNHLIMVALSGNQSQLWSFLEVLNHQSSISIRRYSSLQIFQGFRSYMPETENKTKTKKNLFFIFFLYLRDKHIISPETTSQF